MNEKLIFQNKILIFILFGCFDFIVSWDKGCFNSFKTNYPCLMLHKGCKIIKNTRQDIDWCRNNNGGCQQVCENHVFGPKCKCRKGYKLEADGKSCSDINECSLPGTCPLYINSVCVNYPGSYMCKCTNGNNMLGERESEIYGERKIYLKCVARHWCDQRCDHFCSIYKVLPYKCKCFDYYHMLNGTCVPDCGVNYGECEKYCYNSLYGPICKCAKGQQLAANGKSCIGLPSADAFNTHINVTVECNISSPSENYPETLVLFYNTEKLGLKGEICISYTVHVVTTDGYRRSRQYYVDVLENPPFVFREDRVIVTNPYKIYERKMTIKDIEKKFAIRIRAEIGEDLITYLRNITLYPGSCRDGDSFKF